MSFGSREVTKDPGCKLGRRQRQRQAGLTVGKCSNSLVSETCIAMATPE